MSSARTLVEKAMRAAVQRHIRNWAPYPNVHVDETPKGYRVAWYNPLRPLDASQAVIANILYESSKRSFTIESIQGKRNWCSADFQGMQSHPTLERYPSRGVLCSMHDLEMLTAAECTRHFKQLQQSWSSVAATKDLLRLVELQNFTPKVALSTALDAIADSVLPDCILEEEQHISPYLRIVLGHAMDSGTDAWSCTFKTLSASETYQNINIIAWRADDAWKVQTMSTIQPFLYSDYTWFEREQGLVLQGLFGKDSATTNATTNLTNIERFEKRRDKIIGLERTLYRSALLNMLEQPKQRIDPDVFWVEPLLRWNRVSPCVPHMEPVFHEMGLYLQSTAKECLYKYAVSKQGSQLTSIIEIQESLQGSSQDFNGWRINTMQWIDALNVSEKEHAFLSTIPSSLFEES